MVVLEVARAVAVRAVAAVEMATSAADAVSATAVAATVVADAVAEMEAACVGNSLGNSEHSKRVRTCIQHSAQRHSSTRLTSADSGIQMSQ